MHFNVYKVASGTSISLRARQATRQGASSVEHRVIRSRPHGLLGPSSAPLHP